MEAGHIALDVVQLGPIHEVDTILESWGREALAKSIVHSRAASHLKHCHIASVN